jgi:hypothetical protein
MSGLWSVAWSVLVLLALALTLVPELMMIRRRRSKTLAPALKTRLLQWPIRENGKIFVINPDGSKQFVEPLMAKNQAMAWLDVTAGGYVWHETKLPD